jgi:hypothetical protein
MFGCNTQWTKPSNSCSDEEKEEIRKIYNRDTIKETKVSIPLQIRGGSDFTL